MHCSITSLLVTLQPITERRHNVTTHMNLQQSGEQHICQRQSLRDSRTPPRETPNQMQRHLFDKMSDEDVVPWHQEPGLPAQMSQVSGFYGVSVLRTGGCRL